MLRWLSTAIHSSSNAKAKNLDKQLGSAAHNDDKRFFGLENFGNTCYCNSVLQALFASQNVRQRCIDFAQEPHADDDDGDLLDALCDLFRQISLQKKRVGVLAPRKFVGKLRAVNELFNNQMHQDAHEFLNYLLNEMAELLEKRQKAAPAPAALGSAGGGASERDGGASDDGSGSDTDSDADDAGDDGASSDAYSPKTWVHSIFEGVLTNETKCLSCETVTSRDERFLDLSLEIEQNSSVSACMRNFSASEPLRGENKFYCDTCCALQEAKKCMRIKRLPNVLALHLKRFKYMEQLQRFKKLSYRVSFPQELKVTNTAEGMEQPDRKYRLLAAVVHVGSGANHGHYVSIVRSQGHWLLFDDDSVELVDESSLGSCFGSPVETSASTDTGYILFYEAEEWEQQQHDELPA